MLYLLPPFALAHGSLSTPLPRNAFNTPLNTTAGSKQLIPSYFTNYYDDGCLVGCDSCLHHGATLTNTTMNPWGVPANVGCTVAGEPVGSGVYNITLPGADTLPDYARTWNRLGDRIDVSTSTWIRSSPATTTAAATR